MHQDRVQLAAVQAGQRPGGEHDLAAAGHAVGGGMITVYDPDIGGRSQAGL